jgi:hypothetical protein
VVALTAGRVGLRDLVAELVGDGEEVADVLGFAVVGDVEAEHVPGELGAGGRPR